MDTEELLVVIERAGNFLGGLLMDPAITWPQHARVAVESKRDELYKVIEDNTP